MSENKLESIWVSDLGDRYWALVRSGLQKELTPEEEQKKHAAAEAEPYHWGWLIPGVINAVLVAMTCLSQGRCELAPPSNLLNGFWLIISRYLLNPCHSSLKAVVKYFLTAIFLLSSAASSCVSKSGERRRFLGKVQGGHARTRWFPLCCRLPIVRVGATICIHTCVVSIRLFWRGKEYFVPA